MKTYKCADPHCPGYPYKASDVTHPCGGSRSIVGKRVVFHSNAGFPDVYFTVARVDQTRFGVLAVHPNGKEAYPVDRCAILESEGPY